MRILHPIVAAILLAGLAACGGSGGVGGAAVGGGTTTLPAPQGQALGSRSVPGGTITVTSAAALQAGITTVFRLALSAEMPAPSEARAWIGVDYDPTATGIVATPVASAPGSYDVTLTLPSPLAVGSHVWVRLTFADGSVVETGSGDFLLADR